VLPADVKAVSVDDHLIEPPHLWQDRLPERYRAVGPRVVELEDGTEAWAFEDKLVQTVRGNTRTAPGFDDDALGVARFSEMRPGCYDPKARIEDMDVDGVWAQMCFPDFSRFTGHRFIECEDKALANLCVAAYNDFVVEDWCAAAPERLVPLGIVPLWDVPAAAAEVRRIAARGVRAITFSENPTGLGLPSIYTDHWEPLWDAVAETGVVVCMHIGSSSKLLKSCDDAPRSTMLCYVATGSMMACTDWLFAGVLDRHPTMQIAFSEGGGGWVPYVLEQAEQVFHRYAVEQHFATTRPPRQVFAEHMHVCVLRDDAAIAVIGKDIPAGNIMWESDYPHDSGHFPHSRAELERSMRDVPDDVARRFAETNARHLFRF
jgi:predicted TIM-barrel fold metal-dependent hydrolase